MTTCTACDVPLAEDARFCSKCGAATAATGSWRSAIDDDLRAARAFAEEARQRARSGLDDDLTSSVAKGAAIGAVVGIPVPFVGPVAGAVVGAGIAAINKLTKD